MAKFKEADGTVLTSFSHFDDGEYGFDLESPDGTIVAIRLSRKQTERLQRKLTKFLYRLNTYSD